MSYPSPYFGNMSLVSSYLHGLITGGCIVGIGMLLGFLLVVAARWHT